MPTARKDLAARPAAMVPPVLPVNGRSQKYADRQIEARKPKAAVPKAQLKGFVSREWTCVGFLSTLEASRRVALLTAIAYEPLALRTVHGRLQGTYFAPLFLYT